MNTVSFDHIDKEALEEYKGKTIIVKASGELFTPEHSAQIKNLFHQLAVLKASNIHSILVHGCGNYLNNTFANAGIARTLDADKNFVTTDESIGIVAETMETLNNNICDFFNKVAAQQEWKVKGCGMVSFPQKSPIIAAPHHQRTGKISGIKTDRIADKLVFPVIPILSSLGMDEEGNAYNINADDVACALALEVKAPRLVLLSSTPGVLDGQGQTISRLDQKTAQTLIDAKIITGGMEKKVTQMLNAAAQGIQGVAAMSFYEPYALLKELAYKNGAGSSTLVTLNTSHKAEYHYV